MPDPLHVLVVTPNRDFAQYIQTLLLKENLTSTWLQDSFSVLSLVHSSEPALVVCSQGLEDREGLDVLSDLRSDGHPEPAFILLSANHSPELKRRAQEAEVTSMFEIPFRTDPFLRTVSEIVEASEGRDHLKDA